MLAHTDDNYLIERRPIDTDIPTNIGQYLRVSVLNDRQYIKVSDFAYRHALSTGKFNGPISHTPTIQKRNSGGRTEGQTDKGKPFFQRSGRHKQLMSKQTIDTHTKQKIYLKLSLYPFVLFYNH